MLWGTASQPGARSKTANVRNNDQTEVLVLFMYYESSNMTKSESNMLTPLHLGIFAKKIQHFIDTALMDVLVRHDTSVIAH